ncbi:MAG: phosphatidate cytidylyltransferase [Bacteroidota bacterium]
MSNLITRTITGVFFIAIIIGSILLSQLAIVVLFAIITVLGTWELYKLSEKDGIKPQKIIGVIGAFLLFLSNTFFVFTIPPNLFRFNWEGLTCLLIIPILFLFFIVELFRKTQKPFTNIAYTFLGIIYVALPLSMINYIVCPDPEIGYQPNILLGFFFLLWTYDTVAYLIGINFGKHRLFERISPKKTWEGSIGGAVICFVIAYIISIYFTELGVVDWLVIAAIIIVFSTLGDLVQSLFKRSLNIKDSGKILPGHGGILDRFDGLLLSTPFVFIYLQLIR